MNYELKTVKETVGGVPLTLEMLEDLDKTIDHLCVEIDEGRTRHVDFVEDLCPYFGVVWPAARAVAEHLAAMGGWLKDKTVLELGCGLALPSLVAAKLGARVTATDFHPDVPEFLSRNTRHNGVQIDYRELDWRADTSSLGTFDFVVASDVLYEAKHPSILARVAAAHRTRVGHIVLGDPGRPYIQQCIDQLKASGLRCDILIRNDIFLFVIS